MTEFNEHGQVVASDDLEGSRAWCHIMYALHAISAISGILTSATIVGAFVFGWPSIIAVIINYVTRDRVRNTWLESHWRWQLRTFWFAVLLGIVAGAVTLILIATIIGILIYWLPFAVVGLWVLYRVVRGWINALDRRAMPLPLIQ